MFEIIGEHITYGKSKGVALRMPALFYYFCRQAQDYLKFKLDQADVTEDCITKIQSASVQIHKNRDKYLLQHWEKALRYFPRVSFFVSGSIHADHMLDRLEEEKNNPDPDNRTAMLIRYNRPPGLSI